MTTTLSTNTTPQLPRDAAEQPGAPNAVLTHDEHHTQPQ
eukprot:CAMPEP_0174863890 /NCGR_PEP_ID=MMETSP1114-20130205/57175_1 /TAXON_ID=312471 /ORGANISM="Neobodo designis, Strain CCAP 1951/1" /LENGTH=38 /DNA_ID= /DNA_START= /DNA_END= /DNA_ORIENTATION=